MTRRILAFAAVIGTVMGVSWGTAFAAWLSTSPGTATAKALAMPTGPTPTAPATSTGSVTLSWTAATLAGADLTSYTVRRYPAAGGAGTEITCPQTLTNHTVSCTYTETTAGSYQFTTAAKHANWVGTEGAKSGATTVTLTTTRSFTVVPQAGNRTAGQAFNVTLTAMTNGAVDTAYTGSHTIAITGPNTAITGQKATESVTVTFTAGVGTASVTAYKAETFTLTATEASPSRSGSASVTVVAGAGSKLAWTSQGAFPNGSTVNGTCFFTCDVSTFGRNNSWSSKVSVTDTWANPVSAVGTGKGVTVTRSTGTVTGGTLTFPATGLAETTASFTYTSPNSTSWTTATLTAAATGFGSSTPASATAEFDRQ